MTLYKWIRIFLKLFFTKNQQMKGHDGELLSNSLFFELVRNWTGILIEPQPSLFKKILDLNRNIYVLNACLANKRPLVSKFRLSDSLSGRLSEMHVVHQERIDSETGKVKQLAYVPCFSLHTVLKAIGVSRVDYFSLDVEGGEVDVLNSIDPTKLDIRTFTIEHNGYDDRKAQIAEVMKKKGYKFVRDVWDFYYAKP
jgi:FkbM family methyltransferase